MRAGGCGRQPTGPGRQSEVAKQAASVPEPNRREFLYGREQLGELDEDAGRQHGSNIGQSRICLQDDQDGLGLLPVVLPTDRVDQISVLGTVAHQFNPEVKNRVTRTLAASIPPSLSRPARISPKVSSGCWTPSGVELSSLSAFSVNKQPLHWSPPRS